MTLTYKRGLLAGLAACTLAALPAASGADYIDVLDRPAMISPLSSRSLINGLATAGLRLVGVGQRGHIVYSDDGGVRWMQALVPVSSDLVAVQFPQADLGWAVGHDGVVLHSVDGGAHWRVQLDGRALPQALDKPFLDVYFDNGDSGYVVGAFGLIFHTADGGRSWQSMADQIDNPNGYHLNAIRRIDGEIYVVGEQGLLLKLNRDKQRFEALTTPYRGSYFGLSGAHGGLLVYGLRGNAWRSTDQGRNWRKVATGVQAGLTAAAAAPDGRIVLVSQAGEVLLSTDAGASFQPLKQAPAAPTSAVALSYDGQLVLGGARGLRRQPVAR